MYNTLMQTIDVHDLPEPVAAAIAAMVETLRAQSAPVAESKDSEKVKDLAEFDAILDEFFATDDAKPATLPTTFSREDIYFDHD